MRVELSTAGDLEARSLIAHDLRVTVIPRLGGKISSILWQGTELLAHNPRKAFQEARYAAPFADFDASGFDECLPTIGPCAYPEHPWQGVEAPDHGEVWSIPWEWDLEGEALHLHTHGIRFPYTFEKWIALPAPGRIRLGYGLTNHAPVPFKFLWSSHPLFAPRPGMRIHLPPGVRVRVDWSKGERLGGPGSEHDWPMTRDRHGQAVDLSLILSEESRLVDKLYTTRLDEGWCAVHDPQDGLYIAFLFSPDEIPYAGLSINLGGWPVDGPGYYNLGLEPCNGFPDRLDLAVQRGGCAVAGPGATLRWAMDLCVGRVHDLPLEMERLRNAGHPN